MVQLWLDIWSEHNVIAEPEAVVGGLKEDCPEVQMYIKPCAGHRMQYEAADDINRLLLAWID